MANIYVDLSSTPAGNPGTSSLPYALTEFLAVANTFVGNAYLKGTGAKSGSNGNIGNVSLNWLCWDTSIDSNGVDAPWFLSVAMQAGGNTTFIGDTIEGGIVTGGGAVSGTFAFSATDFVDCFLQAKGGNAGPSELCEATYKGCTLKAAFGWAVPGNFPTVLTDCVSLSNFSGDTSLFVITKCAFTVAALTTNVAPVDPEFSYVAPSFNLTMESTLAFSLWIDNAYASTWAGSSPYTGYAKGLWRTPRAGIGALDFPVVTTTPPPPLPPKENHDANSSQDTIGMPEINQDIPGGLRMFWKGNLNFPVNF